MRGASSRPPRRSQWRPRLAVGFAAVVLLLLGLAAFTPSVSAQVRAWFNRWFQYSVPTSQTHLQVEGFTAFTPWAPAWLPQGFDLVETGIHQAPEFSRLTLVFTAGNKQIRVEQQQAASAPALPEGIELTWGEVHAIYQDASSYFPPEIVSQFGQGPVRRITWNQGGLHFELYSNLERDEMMRVAESFAPVKAGK